MSLLFFTGATGFLGSNLLSSIINEKSHKEITILVRDRKKAEDILKEQLEMAMERGIRIAFAIGEINKPNLGLSSIELEKVKEADEVIHCAGNVSLSQKPERKKEIFETNFDGVKNMLEVFKDSKKLKNFYDFSTAYAAGKTGGKIKENWLPKPEYFRNFYEEAKWNSEMLIKKYIKEFKMPITILRPSIICVSSASDIKKVKAQTLYLYSSGLIHVLKMENGRKDRFKIMANLDANLNFIPVEDLIALVQAIRHIKKKKRIYNLVNPENFSAKAFFEGFESGIGAREKFLLKEHLERENLSPAEETFYGYSKKYEGYLCNSINSWSTSNTKEIRRKLNLPGRDDKWFSQHVKDSVLLLKNMPLEKPKGMKNLIKYYTRAIKFKLNIQ